ncbi:MAG TPA: hypothetical protein VFS43_21580 [Polyangiaceae bacterium]|nr:hypothetical protein [Polyangiaceae bacterium]
MASLWGAFQECGWPAYAVLFFSLVSLMGGVVALALAAQRFRYAKAAAALALALALGATALGPVGTFVQRRRVEGALAGVPMDPAQVARILAAGYGEAAQCTNLGLGAGALPLLLAAGALALAFGRRPKPAN